MYGLLADLVVVAHLAFVLFVALGGLSVWRWPRLAWVHLPAVAWGVTVEWSGAICPLTPLELSLRRHGGQAGYDGDFIEQYLLPMLYPAGLTREMQLALGGAVLGLNLLFYSRWLLMGVAFNSAWPRYGTRPSHPPKGSDGRG